MEQRLPPSSACWEDPDELDVPVDRRRSTKDDLHEAAGQVGGVRGLDPEQRRPVDDSGLVGCGSLDDPSAEEVLSHGHRRVGPADDPRPVDVLAHHCRSQNLARMKSLLTAEMTDSNRSSGRRTNAESRANNLSE